MKNLWIIRHATAASGGSLMDDFNRPLEAVGMSEACNTGNFILKSGLVPECIVSSAAVRTMETSKIILKQLGNRVELRPDLGLYNCGFQTLLKNIRSVDDQIAHLAVVGHNPGISQLASVLSESETYQMAPSSAVCLRFQEDKWSLIVPGLGKQIHFFSN